SGILCRIQLWTLALFDGATCYASPPSSAVDLSGALERVSVHYIEQPQSDHVHVGQGRRLVEQYRVAGDATRFSHGDAAGQWQRPRRRGIQGQRSRQRGTL